VKEPTLQWVEDAVAGRAPASVAHPIRDALFPRLDKARTLEDAEKVIHDAAHALPWLGAALVEDAAAEQLQRDAVVRALPRMLTIQDDLERLIEATFDAVTARKAILAHETFRRLLAVCADAPRSDSGITQIPAAVKPSIDYMRDVALRLALLIVAVERLIDRASALVPALADKAFKTSQTLRHFLQEFGIDLTPWLDAPPQTRAKRILEAAKGFWDSLNDEQRRAVGEAWGERVELPLRWPPPSS
jgi:hypothetical protein